jgi:pSer/pThr/pTyr-binding forkhead associated (FHA) protein
MNLSLVVQTAGKQEGKVLDIRQPQFLVGRDPQCHLRPASALISKRHCALLQREGKVFVRDFDSTNGTFVNDQPVKGEIELKNDDKLRIGPLLFVVKLQAGAPVNRPTPPPATKAPAKPGAAAAAKEATPPPPAKAPTMAPESPGSDDDIAAMLLSIQDDSQTGTTSSGAEVPDGSTVLDLVVPPDAPGGSPQAAKDKEGKEKAKTASGNTSSAAKSILEKYMKRPRG